MFLVLKNSSYRLSGHLGAPIVFVLCYPQAVTEVTKAQAGRQPEKLYHTSADIESTPKVSLKGWTVQKTLDVGLG
jgi:hypothetical protein